MGYTTIFLGTVSIDPPLNDSEVGFLNDLATTRRMSRDKGPLYVGPGLEGVLDHNQPDNDQPGLWCQWVPSDDGTELEWDGGEKFYNAAEWMKYIVNNLLSGEWARSYVADHIDEDARLKDFTFDHTVNGEIDAEGEEGDDLWKIVVENSTVKVAQAVIHYAAPEEI